MSHPWPLFDLRLRTPRLELRLPTDDDLLGLLEVVRDGIADEGRDVFIVPWHELPSPALERQFLLYNWQLRGSWEPKSWRIPLAVFAEGRVIGLQAVAARAFNDRRTVASGSYLGREFQGLGFGTEMRAAILWLAFECLGAEVAESGYIEGNDGSRRVSEKLGYVANGLTIIAPRGKAIVEHDVRVTRETWARDLVKVSVEGLEGCLPLFGAAELGENEWRKL